MGTQAEKSNLSSERLLAMLRIEIDALEVVYKDNIPSMIAASGGAAEACRPPAAARAKTSGTTTKRRAAGDAGDAKVRVEALSQMTRTLEKLLELRNVEAAATGDGASEAETARLREEFLQRLRRLDAQRLQPTGIFDVLGAAETGKTSEVEGAARAAAAKPAQAR